MADSAADVGGAVVSGGRGGRGQSDRSPAEWLTALLGLTGAGHAPAGGSNSDRRPQLWQCPAHRDSTPSLTIRPSTEHPGAVLLHCHAGCPTSAILHALALTFADLYQPPAQSPAAWLRSHALTVDYPPLQLDERRGGGEPERLEAVHDYGQFQLLRWRGASGHKRLSWEHRDPAGVWIPGLGGVPASALPLYREADLPIVAGAGEPLYVVESESSVDALNRCGHYAITWAGGASCPPLDKLADATTTVVDLRVIADHDPAGMRCAVSITRHLGRGRLLVPRRPGEDVRDVVGRDPQLRTLIDLTDAAARLTAAATPTTRAG